jgi:hypothetical protein
VLHLPFPYREVHDDGVASFPGQPANNNSPFRLANSRSGVCLAAIRAPKLTVHPCKVGRIGALALHAVSGCLTARLPSIDCWVAELRCLTGCAFGR